MSTERRPSRLAVWMHERTGDYYVVGDESTTAVGPIAAQQILRRWRVAAAPSEPVLGIANYHEHERPVPLPFPATEWLEVEADWLPPSVTVHEHPTGALDVDWFTPDAAERARLLALAGETVDPARAIFGRLDRVALWGHPRGSIIVCGEPIAGAQLVVIEWP